MIVDIWARSDVLQHGNANHGSGCTQIMPTLAGPIFLAKMRYLDEWLMDGCLKHTPCWTHLVHARGQTEDERNVLSNFTPEWCSPCKDNIRSFSSAIDPSNFRQDHRAQSQTEVIHLLAVFFMRHLWCWWTKANLKSFSGRKINDFWIKTTSTRTSQK